MAKNGSRDGGGRFVKGTSGNPGGKAKRIDTAAVLGVQHLDGWMNTFTGHGVMGLDKRQGTSFQTTYLNFDQLAELWRGDDLAARAVEILPKEAMRPGYDLLIPEEEENTGADESERIAMIEDRLKVLGADMIIRQGLNYERGLGGGAVLMGANDGQTDLTQPLDLEKIRSLDWLTPLEPRELYPVFGYADPRAPKYGQPQIYRLTSRAILPPQGGQYTETVMDIHESRLLIFPGIRVSRYQPMAAQGGWGDAVLTRMWRVLRDFNLAWGSAGVLVSEFGTAVYKMKDLWEALTTKDGQKLFMERLQMMALARSTINASVIDANDDFKRESTPIAGLPDLMDKFATRLAASADMPLTLLFGTSPAGLSATGESDIRFFYDRVAAYQREKVQPQLEQLIKILFRTTGNKTEPAKWHIRFKPLWQESAADKAKAMLTFAQADHIWIQDQVLSAEEVADAHWGSGEWNPDITVDFESREKQEAAAAGPVTEDDLRAIGRLEPAYQPPPPQGSAEPAPDTTPPGKAAAPDPETAPKPIVGNADAADWDEGQHPRDESGKFSEGGGGDRSLSPGEAELRRGAAQDMVERWSEAFSLVPNKSHDSPKLAEVTTAARSNGGVTFNPHTGEQPKQGYAVSLHKGLEMTIPGKDALTTKHVEAYLESMHTVFDRDHKACIGGWYNASDDKWYLDVSHVESSLADAVHLGQAHHQLAVYDLGRGESIDAHEYQDALTRKGRFTGRTDAARGTTRDRAGSGAGPANHDAGRDGSRHEGASGRGAKEARTTGVIRNDFDPDEDRDEGGRWTGGGGGSEHGQGGTPAATAESWAKENPAGNVEVFHTAGEYLRQAEMRPLPTLSKQNLSAEEGQKIAGSYDAAHDDPKNPQTIAAYRAFNTELAAQRAVAERAGYKFEPWTKVGQPYATSKDMMKDVRENKHLYFFKSTEGTTPNALMTLDENDTFRAVHDLFGHAMAGNQFGPKGETNAFLDHVQMFSTNARLALATETIGQNAWFNFSKTNEGKPVGERRFADQKSFILDPHLYQPLIDRSMVPAPKGHTDAADEQDLYFTCPCHRRAKAGRTDDFSPDQERDETGKWTSSGGGTAAKSGKTKTVERAAPEKPGHEAWRGKAAGAVSTKAAHFKDGKWDAERAKIHDKYAEDASRGLPKSEHQTVYMTGGGPASGKSSGILSNPEAHVPGRDQAAHIDADQAKSYLPEFNAGKQAGAADAAAFVHDESAHMTRLAMARALQNGHDVVYDSTGDGGMKELTEKVAALRAQGAKHIVANYATCDVDEACRRNIIRAKTPGRDFGRLVPEPLVRGIHREVARTASKAIREGLFDEAKVWDTTKKEPTLVAEYSREHGFKVDDPDRWDAFVKRGDAPPPPGWE